MVLDSTIVQSDGRTIEQRRAQMLTAKQKTQVRDAVTADKVTFKKDGTVEMRYGFFYRNNNDAGKCAARWTEQMASAGFKATTVETDERWQAWPKDSYWSVVFKVEAAAS